MAVTCAKCGCSMGDTAKFCRYCGSGIQAPHAPGGAVNAASASAGAICKSCGRTVGLDERFCKSCGASIVKGARVSAPSDRNDKSSYVLGIIAICFAAIGAAWSFIGGVCCGWAGWGYAFIGLVLAIISLVLKPSTVGWWALGLAIFSFAWLIIAPFILAASISTWTPTF